MTHRAHAHGGAVALLAVGLAAVGAVVILVSVAHLRTPAARALPVAFGSLAPAPTSAAVRVRGPSSTHPIAHATTRPATTRTPPAQPDGSRPPVQLRIPALHVDAAIEPTASVRRAIAVPADPAVVGWWAAGQAPGSVVGSTVLVGHVDSARDGPGALFRLDRLSRGDAISVSTSRHLQQAYRVRSLQIIPKSSGIPSDVFTETGAPRLVLVTCGGPFDPDSKSYADNIVVIATPL